MKVAVLRSIKPYWVFLIIARKMGWDVPQEKTIEVGKNKPYSADWNKQTYIYCSKNKKSFKRIPEQYQPLMKPLLGKVVGEFVCDEVEQFTIGCLRCDDIEEMACMSFYEMCKYFYKDGECDGKTAKNGYGWHISDLKVYDKPKELSDFDKPCNHECIFCDYYSGGGLYEPPSCDCEDAFMLTRPPRSWCYVEVEE